ncbi:uric acid transporter [Janthinobacterium sp. CG_23.3]|uniref:nucleobase:cation symporter-2 family protein n=1 Tax=Janthinobacterium sp. CG_23.3 TaxID=3349634 RepID=UPI0038D3E363
MTSSAQLHSVDEVLPRATLCVLGLQHVLVMYAGAIAVPLIVGGALRLPKEELAFLISADLFCCGLVTMLQCIGVWNIGIRLPVMMGVAFTAVAPIIAIGLGPGLGMPAVFGAVIASGVFTYVAAPYMSGLARWFPPVVTGTVVLVIGISLLRVGINWVAGGQPTLPGPHGPVANPLYGVPLNLGIAASVLATVLLVSATLRGFLANISVLLGIAVGCAIAVVFGKVSFAGIGAAAWFNLVTPFHFGPPSFDPMAIATLSVVMVVIMIESTGLFMALGEISERPVSERDLARGLRADGVGNIIGGVFGTFSYTSYSQNIGLVQITGVRSRWVCAVAGAMLVVLGCVPKLAFLAASIPPYVLGGAAMVMFGMVAASGVKILSRADFHGNGKNLYVVAVSVALGMIPLVAEHFFAQLPELAAKFLHNGILLGSFSAVLLNLLFNRPGRAARTPFGARDEPRNVA